MKRRRPLLVDLALSVLVTGVVVAAGWMALRDDGPAGEPELDIEERVKVLCSTCHLLPTPDILPRAVWQYEVEKMYELAGAKEDIEDIPPIELTLEYFTSRAPESLRPLTTYLGEAPGPLRFEARGYRSPGAESVPAISFLKYAHYQDDAQKELLICDMRSGLVLSSPPHQPAQILARLAHPAHVEVVDLDQDGRRDLLVAELGSFLPMDSDRGKVIWVRTLADGSRESIPLLEGVGRVADVQAADLDGDGDLDLVVAAFGWRTTGKVYLLENRGLDERGIPQFLEEELDPSPGAINVPIVDLNGDGRLDIIVLLAQQFETVLAYLSDENGWYKRHVIYEGPHPDWGSAGIEVVDLDADGDLDVVLVSGDTLDNKVLKPHQGVQLLENRGTFPFHERRLAFLAGAHKVRAADLDGDGDLDLAACAFLPQLREEGLGSNRSLDSVLWIEQTGPAAYEPHPIESVKCDHPSLEVGDFDGDGKMEIVVGNLLMEPPIQGKADWATFFAHR